MSSDNLYMALRKAIVDGEVHPNERLVEAEIAERYGVGRAAVRTALVRLTQDGLVEHERNRGARVRFVDADEATEIYETRALLEGLTARKAAERIDEAGAAELRTLVADIRRLLDAGDLMAASRRNAELHDVIVRMAAHRTAARMLAGLNSQLVSYQYRTILHPGRAERSFAEHTAIVDAILRRDAGGAEDAMREHMQALTETLSEPIPPRLGD